MKIQFTIPGNPVPKARPRVTRSGHAYTPKKTAEYEKLVKVYAIKTMDEHGLKPTGEAIRLDVQAFFQIPKSWSLSKKKNAAYGVLKPIGRPDADNCIKAVQDAMNGIVYKDDSQIVELIGGKHYSYEPRVEVTVKTMGELPVFRGMMDEVWKDALG